MIDLNTLPSPDAIEFLNYETILAEKKELLLSIVPNHQVEEVSRTLELESEPLTILLQTYAYDNLVMRQRINEATLATHLASANGTDLEHKGAEWNLERKIIQQADPEAKPPIMQILESDEDYRRRIHLAPHKLSTAGPVFAYIAHALDAHHLVKDAFPTRPVRGTVRMHIMSYNDDGQPEPETIEAVKAYLGDERKRPLTDHVEVVPAISKQTSITYEIEYTGSPQIDVTKAEIQRRLLDLKNEKQKLGITLSRLHIIGALNVLGVERANLISPETDIECASHEYPLVTEITGVPYA